jgi:hypothetical protein
MTLEQEKQELLDLLEKYTISIESRTPYGVQEFSIGYFSKDDQLIVYYNSYYRKSLLHNDNKWL